MVSFLMHVIHQIERTVRIFNLPISIYKTYFCLIIGSFILLTVRHIYAQGAGTEGSESGSFSYNEILDDSPIFPKKQLSFTVRTERTGLKVGAYTGLYSGAAASYLSPDFAALDQGTFPNFGMYIGGHFWLPVELGLSVGLGLGRTFERGNYDDAYDILIRPQLIYHAIDWPSWTLTGISGIQINLYDNEFDEVSQLGMGPYLGAGAIWKLSPQNELLFEGGTSYLWNPLAYSFRSATQQELEDNPDVDRYKTLGEWFQLFQVNIYWRILGF